MSNYPDDLSLPDLKTRPLYGRTLLAMLILGLGGLALGLLLVDRLLPSSDPDMRLPSSARCDDPQAGQVIYQLHPDESELRYEVDERLLALDEFNVVQGRTRSLTGAILIDHDDPANSRVCEVVVNMASFQSDNAQRDRILRLGYLDAVTHPEATFRAAQLQGFPAEPERGAPLRFEMTGPLTVKGITHDITWQVNATLEEDDTLRGTAQTFILMSDYDLGPVRLAGFVESADDVSLRFEFVARP